VIRGFLLIPPQVDMRSLAPLVTLVWLVIGWQCTMGVALGSPGNGRIQNQTEATVRVAVQPKGLGMASRRTFELAPGRSLNLKNHPEYDVVLVDQRTRYPLDVARNRDGQTPRSLFFHIDRRDGRLVLVNGLAQAVLDEAREVAGNRAEAIRQRWTLRTAREGILSAGNGVTLEPSLGRTVERVAFTEAVFQQTGLYAFLHESWTDQDYLVVLGEPTDSGTTDRLRAAWSGFRTEPEKGLRVMNLYGDRETADSIRLLQQLSDSVESPVRKPASRTQRAAGFNYSPGITVRLGEYAGIDGSESPIDRAVAELQKIAELKRSADFDFLGSTDRLIHELLHAWIYQNPENESIPADPTEYVPWPSELLRDEVEAVYAYAFAREVRPVADEWMLAISERGAIPITAACRIDPNGEITDILAHNRYGTHHYPRSVNWNIEIEYRGIKELNVRPRGFCLLESISRNAELVSPAIMGQWRYVAPGPCDFVWGENARYCVRVVSVDDTVRYFDFETQVFRPSRDRKYVFTTAGWEAIRRSPTD